MRVLTVGNMYPPHHLGGYELMWRSSVAQLRDAGHEVRVLTTDYRNPEPDPAIEEDPDVHRELRWYWRDHSWPRLSVRERWRLERHNLRLLDRHLRDLRPDVVAWWAMGGMSMSLIERARRAGIPAVGVVHDDWLLYGHREDQWQRAVRRLGPARRLVGLLTKVPSRLNFDHALEWMVVSRVILGHARSGGWALPRHEVVPAGVDRGLFRPQPKREWGGGLLCVGRLDRRKGVHTAIAALGELPETRLRVVGTGDRGYQAELEDEITKAGVRDRVSFETMTRELIPGAYRDADAVLFPVNWEEPFGLVPLEAMAVGRPVVASGRGGSTEFLRDGENCLLYGPAEDHHALAAAVRRVAESPAIREQLRTGGFVTAARLDEAAFGRQFLLALRRAVARGP